MLHHAALACRCAMKRLRAEPNPVAQRGKQLGTLPSARSIGFAARPGRSSSATEKIFSRRLRTVTAGRARAALHCCLTSVHPMSARGGSCKTDRTERKTLASDWLGGRLEPKPIILRQTSQVANLLLHWESQVEVFERTHTDSQHYPLSRQAPRPHFEPQGLPGTAAVKHHGSCRHLNPD